MRFSYLVILIYFFSLSCKTVQEQSVFEPKADTLQFTYLYSEALKNKMLGNEAKAKEQFFQCYQLNNSSSASAYQLSILYQKEKDFINAIKYAELCLKQQPDNEWYILHRASIAKELNDNATYRFHFKKLSMLFPSNISYNYEYAIICFEEKKYDEALNILVEIEEITGVDENVSFLRNNINYQLKNYDAIQNELLKLKVFFPDSIKYMDMLAEFYVNFNQPDRALSLYRNMIQTDSGNMNAHYGLAYIYGKTSNFRLGYPSLKIALSGDQIESSRKEKLAVLYLHSPEGYFTDNEIDTMYSLMIYHGNANIELINEYLSFLYQLKKLTQTEKVSRYSIKKHPGNFLAWDYLFNIFLAQSRFDELNLSSLKALEYFPNHASVYFYCGYSYFVQRKYNEAIKYFESGIDYLVDNKSLEQQFYLCLAESYHHVNKHKKSDEFFDRYLSNDSTNAYLLNNYAYYLTARNVNLDKAERLSLKSIEIEPFNSIFLDTYSWILYSMGNYSKALNFIQRAYRYGGNKNAVVIEHYGDILFKTGNTKEALERYQEASSLNRNNKQLIEKINTLSKIE